VSAGRQRLSRLLVLVPWVLAHDEPRVTEVCERFAISANELVADLELLFLCGVPGYGPGDLIDAGIEGGRVHISMAGYFAQPPPLTWKELTGLYVAGRALAAVPGGGEKEQLESALAKLEAALTEEDRAALRNLADRVTVDLETEHADAPHLEAIRDAIHTRTRLELEYSSEHRGSPTRRRVDPWFVFGALGHWYLAGYCHLAEGERVFRLDRMVSVHPTGESYQPPADLDPSGAAERLLRGPSGIRCVLDLSREAAWVAEYYPVKESRPLAGAGVRVELEAASLDWAVRLVFQLAPHAVPVQPPELVQAVRVGLDASLARYTGG